MLRRYIVECYLKGDEDAFRLEIFDNEEDAVAHGTLKAETGAYGRVDVKVEHFNAQHRTAPESSLIWFYKL